MFSQDATKQPLEKYNQQQKHTTYQSKVSQKTHVYKCTHSNSLYIIITLPATHSIFILTKSPSPLTSRCSWPRDVSDRTKIVSFEAESATISTFQEVSWAIIENHGKKLGWVVSRFSKLLLTIQAVKTPPTIAAQLCIVKALRLGSKPWCKFTLPAG